MDVIEENKEESFHIHRRYKFGSNFYIGITKKKTLYWFLPILHHLHFCTSISLDRCIEEERSSSFDEIENIFRRLDVWWSKKKKLRNAEHVRQELLIRDKNKIIYLSDDKVNTE